VRIGVLAIQDPLPKDSNIGRVQTCLPWSDISRMSPGKIATTYRSTIATRAVHEFRFRLQETYAITMLRNIPFGTTASCWRSQTTQITSVLSVSVEAPAIPNAIRVLEGSVNIDVVLSADCPFLNGGVNTLFSFFAEWMSPPNPTIVFP
jgi:hypothetical protein